MKKNKDSEDKKKQDEIEVIKKQVHKDVDPETKKSTLYFVQEQLQQKLLYHDKLTSKEVPNSVTSTYFEPAYLGQNSLRLLTENEIRQLYYDIGKEINPQGQVVLNTSLGPITISLYCNYVPKTCENFMELCEKKYFDNTIFHRLVQNFIVTCFDFYNSLKVQGGDPTRTGYGGESIFGKAFEDEFHEKLSHNRSGLVSMANSGPDTNKSQFFITLNECKHLDNKHTIFGEVTDGLSILDLINAFEIGENFRPKPAIKIFDAQVICNPFRKAIKLFREHNCNKKEVLEYLKDNKYNKKNKQNGQQQEENTNDLLNALLND